MAPLEISRSRIASLDDAGPMVATIFVRLIVGWARKYPILDRPGLGTPPINWEASMSPILVLAILFATVLAFRFRFRLRAPRKRPVFGQNDIFAGRMAEGLLHALISDRGYLRADTRVRGFDGTAVVVERDGACGRLILCPALGFGRENDLPGLRLLAARHAAEPATTLVVIGGDEEFGRQALLCAAPLHALHVDDSGSLREARAGFGSRAARLVVDNALDRMEADLKEGAFPSLDFETARSLAVTALTTEPGSRPPARGVVTVALTAAIVACFAVEAAISLDSLRGEGAALTVVYRMGAIYRPAILGGEWQRLLAAPFLHFGLLHLAMNGWAQWSLGTPIEFLVGPWRFLGLWVGSALGASLTSLALNESSVSAGASGAIFGLLGAFTTFVFFRKDVLPQPVPRSLRNGVLSTLLLNVMISFIPGIDMAAHAGGFVVGAALAFGLRRDRSREELPPPPGRLRLAVAFLVLLGVGVTSLQERADQSLQVPPIETEHALADLSLPIPRAFAVSRAEAQGLVIVEADGGPASPFSLTYNISEAQADEAGARRVLQTLRGQKAGVRDSGWLAFSQLGVKNRRAIEIVVTAPASCSEEAKTLVADLAKRIR